MASEMVLAVYIKGSCAENTRETVQGENDIAGSVPNFDTTHFVTRNDYQCAMHYEASTVYTGSIRSLEIEVGARERHREKR